MENKFNIGDRVRSKFYGVVGTIMEIDTDGYILKPDTDDDMWIADTDVEQYDPKTAFLSELKGLLEKYGAELGDSGMYEIEGMEVTFDNGDRIRYKHCTINALNIMDYDKE